GASRAAIETEVRRATSPNSTHAATIAYHIDNATIVNGSVYARNHKIFITKERPTNRQNISRYQRAALVSSEFGTRYFGHWLADDCIQYSLADQIGFLPLCLARPPTKVGIDQRSHQKQYEMYFGQDWTPVDRCRVDKLI